MGHLIWGKAYDLEVGRQETSSFLQVLLDMVAILWVVRAAYEAKECWELRNILAPNMVAAISFELANFFFARSPEAPSITRMVFSRISSGTDIVYRVWLVDAQYNSLSFTILNRSIKPMFKHGSKMMHEES